MKAVSDNRIHVYFMPGLAASPDIFQYIELPTDRFEMHLLDWILPEPEMDLSAYAEKVASGIRHPDPVLVGVSFGGMLVQEMTRYVNVRKVIIISSIKSVDEMPRRLVIARYTKLHRLLPTGVINNLEVLTRFAFGDMVKKRLRLYERYLGMREKEYLDWAIDQIVHWERRRPVEELVHIHGDRDAVFPISHIGECITLREGTHTMIIHRYKWFNERLPAIILQDAGSI